MSNNKTQNKEVKMQQITSLEQMELIVLQNRSLSWDGWNVVELTKTPGAMFSPQGVLVKGVWYLRDIFTINQDGWSLPIKYVR